jgi:5-formyltetrahydrofolate cyclo-ligase
VALAFDHQVFAEVPAGDDDWNVDAIVTPTRIVECKGRETWR